MASTTALALSNALKRLWRQKDLAQHMYTDRPFLGIIPKNENISGYSYYIVTRHAPGKGRSALFATAQANKGPSQYARFELTTVDDYALFSVTGKALRLAKKDPWAAVKEITKDGDAVLNQLYNSIATAMYGTGSGSVAQVQSGGAGTTLTLKPGANMAMLEVGTKVVSDDVDGGGAADTHPYEITACNPDPDVRTITRAGGNWNADGDFSDNDYVFPEGDYDAKLVGLRGWVPDSAPAATAFFGVDRTVNILKLGGMRYTSTVADGTISRVFIKCAGRLFAVGGKPDTILMNPLDWLELVNEMESKVTYERKTARGADGPFASVGYDTIKVMGAAGPLSVYPDPFCPKGRAFMLTLNTWSLDSVGACPGWLNEDDQGNILREGTADAYEGRLGCYPQMSCEYPGYNCTIDLTAVL